MPLKYAPLVGVILEQSKDPQFMDVVDVGGNTKAKQKCFQPKPMMQWKSPSSDPSPWSKVLVVEELQKKVNRNSEQANNILAKPRLATITKVKKLVGVARQHFKQWS